MRASLECVLLDGLSVVEALKVHKGPTEHVLQKAYLQKKEENETPVDDAGTLNQLNMVFVEDLQKPMYDYLKKLDGVNFPIEDCLVVGLAKIIVEEFPVEQRLSFPDSVWNQWVANYRKEHPEFED